MSETDEQRRIQVALNNEHARIWRNTVGEAWLGRDFTIRDGRVFSGNAYRVTYGLGPGSSDLVGPISIEVTPAMVGSRIAVFSAFEVKKMRGSKYREGQQRFIDVIQGLGGIADYARSVEEALEIVNRFRSRC
jgi:hypothetical protein